MAREPRNPRLNVLAGVAWTPGLPGGGGGSGGPWEPAVAGGYTVGDVLPCLPGGSDCSVVGASRDGLWVFGWSFNGQQTLRPCTNEAGEPTHDVVRRPVAWQLDPDGRFAHVHDLPHAPIVTGQDQASVKGINRHGLAVGYRFSRWKSSDCADPDWHLAYDRPVAWRRAGETDWELEELPSPGGRILAGWADGVNDAGWIVGHLWIADPRSGTERAGPVVWRPEPLAATGWSVDWLPLPEGADTVTASFLSDSGFVAGIAHFPPVSGGPTYPVVWELDLFGGWQVSLLDTLGGEFAAPRRFTQDGSLVGQASTGVIEPSQGGNPALEHVHAARWQRNPVSRTWFSPEDLGTLDGHRSWAHDQAGSDFVVGKSTFDARQSDDYRAVAWDGTVPTRLDAATQGRWTFTDAPAILPSGRIVVRGWEGNNGPEQWMLLEPVE